MGAVGTRRRRVRAGIGTGDSGDAGGQWLAWRGGSSGQSNGARWKGGTVGSGWGLAAAPQPEAGRGNVGGEARLCGWSAGASRGPPHPVPTCGTQAGATCFPEHAADCARSQTILFPR